MKRWQRFQSLLRSGWRGLSCETRKQQADGNKATAHGWTINCTDKVIKSGIKCSRSLRNNLLLIVVYLHLLSTQDWPITLHSYTSQLLLISPSVPISLYPSVRRQRNRQTGIALIQTPAERESREPRARERETKGIVSDPCLYHHRSNACPASDSGRLNQSENDTRS